MANQWTEKDPDRDAVIVMLHRDGATQAQIAERVGVSRATVARFLRAEGLSDRRQLRRGAIRVSADRAPRATLEELAARHRVSVSTVQRALRRA